MNPDLSLIGRSQRGAVLVIGLIFLLLMTIIGISAMSGNLMEERMSGNTRDMNLALQAAEAALRDGEADVVANVSPESTFDSLCSNGLCGQRTDSTPWWAASPAPTWRLYGSSTGAPNLAGVSQQPRYIIEQPAVLVSESLAIGNKPQANGWAYRITAIGFGMRAETRVVLQSVYIVR